MSSEVSPDQALSPPRSGGSVGICKRPDCGNPLTPTTRGRARQFCSPECARRYHNAARVRAHATAPGEETEPLTELESLMRHAVVLVRAAREQATAMRADRDRLLRERDEALEAARHAEAEISRARQAEADARAEIERVRADAARERDGLSGHYQARLDAVTALTSAERARAERAEARLDALRGSPSGSPRR